MGGAVEIAQHAQYERIAGTFAGGWIFRFQTRHVGDPISGRNRRCAKRSGDCIQRRLYFAEHRDIAGIIEAKLTCRRRDLYYGGNSLGIADRPL